MIMCMFMNLPPAGFVLQQKHDVVLLILFRTWVGVGWGGGSNAVGEERGGWGVSGMKE